MSGKKFFTPLSYPIVITLFGMMGVPSNLFIIGLTFNQTIWYAASQTTFLMDALFYWAVISLVIHGWLIGAGLQMLKNVQVEDNN